MNHVYPSTQCAIVVVLDPLHQCADSDRSNNVQLFPVGVDMTEDCMNAAYMDNDPMMGSGKKGSNCTVKTVPQSNGNK